MENPITYDLFHKLNVKCLFSPSVNITVNHVLATVQTQATITERWQRYKAGYYSAESI